MIDITHLDEREIEMIGKCLKAVASGSYFPEWEFETLFGMKLREVAIIAKGWPKNASVPQAGLAVINTLVNLSGYPHGLERELEEQAAGPKELRRLLIKVRQVRPVE